MISAAVAPLLRESSLMTVADLVGCDAKAIRVSTLAASFSVMSLISVMFRSPCRRNPAPCSGLPRPEAPGTIRPGRLQRDRLRLRHKHQRSVHERSPVSSGKFNVGFAPFLVVQVGLSNAEKRTLDQIGRAHV